MCLQRRLGLRVKRAILYLTNWKTWRVFECKGKSPAPFQDRVAAEEALPCLDHCKYMKVKLPQNRLTHHRYPSTWASIGLVGILKLVKEVRMWGSWIFLKRNKDTDWSIKDESVCMNILDRLNNARDIFRISRSYERHRRRAALGVGAYSFWFQTERRALWIKK